MEGIKIEIMTKVEGDDKYNFKQFKIISCIAIDRSNYLNKN